MPRVEANGISIEYDIRGEGEPLLLVMGLAGQLIDWTDDFIAPLVEAGYQVIRFDNRDIGLSTQSDWAPPTNAQAIRSMLTRRPMKGLGYTIPDMAADAAGLLDALGIASAHVVGASMGGMIAQLLTLRHSSQVISLCSIMSNTGDRTHGGIAGRLLSKVIRRKPPTRETAVDDAVYIFDLISGPHFDADEYRVHAEMQVARSFQPDGVARQTAAIAGTRDRTKLLASVTAPTLVIHGLVDPLVKPSGGIATARAVPGARLLAFTDMGHDLPRPLWPEIHGAIHQNCRRAAVVAE